MKLGPTAYLLAAKDQTDPLSLHLKHRNHGKALLCQYLVFESWDLTRTKRYSKTPRPKREHLAARAAARNLRHTEPEGISLEVNQSVRARDLCRRQLADQWSH